MTNQLEKYAFPLGRNRDACGVGAVSVGRDKAGRLPLDLALKAVRAFEHRGACMPDGTGDGAGFLTDIPRAFLARVIRQSDSEIPDAFLDSQAWGVAVLMFPQDLAQDRVQEVSRLVFEKKGMSILAWRRVPHQPDVLSATSRATVPVIVQAILRWPADGDEMKTLRFVFKVQRALEEAFRVESLPVYIASLSNKTLVYKGMMDGAQFGGFFPDLSEKDFLVCTVVFHRRFATNTSPNWNMCQPFRLICHNGEINTIPGNRNAVRIWERYVRKSGRFDKDWPYNALIGGQSDSADLDSALQAYHAEGRSLAYTVSILMPPSWENRVRNFSPEMKAFFEYHKRAMVGMGAWEGPAAIIAYDGHQLVASLDRMGLRPLRVSQSEAGVFLASSEIGVFGHQPELIVYRDQLVPGAIVRFDLASRRIVHSADVYYEIVQEATRARKLTFRETNHRQVLAPTSYGINDTPHEDLSAFREKLGAFLRAYGWDSQLRLASTNHLADVGKEETYSMGHDRPLACLSTDAPTLYRYFLQRFALVTNPPIDPYREGRDMSLVTYLGRVPDVPPRISPDAKSLRLKSPILTSRTLREITHKQDMVTRVLSLSYPAKASGAELKGRLDRLIADASEQVRQGAELLVLSDRGCFAKNEWPIPAPLAVAAINDRLSEEGLRPMCSLIVQSGEISEGHDLAVLLGLGADAVHPHALFRYGTERLRRAGRPVGPSMRNVQEGLEESLLKIMSKMGIATIQGYRDSCLFEVVGLGEELMVYMARVPSRIGGIGFEILADDIRRRVRHAMAIDDLPQFDCDERAYNDRVRMALWRVAETQGDEEWRRFAGIADARRPTTIRDLLDIAVPEGVESKDPLPAVTILRDCFVTGAMSHGALTTRAHGAIARAAGELGMLSNSGEGGEDRRRNRMGELSALRSRIRQVATGRFGVDAEYLVNGDEIQIKMAQGAKPGEGGQLMASKVTREIAALRYCRPGINLISPPPHHDIYSIEDLKQLIYDLRAVNPEAKISVKLCAVTGIGTIAAGVVKAGADIIEIDGLEGGTGASPRSSLEHAGLPTELGLREVHLALCELGLRDAVILRAAGGVKTDLDALKYMLMGADQITLATTLMIAQGCVHCNCCHTGFCPTDIAGSKHKKAEYPGSSEHVKRYLSALGNALAGRIARMGFRHPKELVGRTDLLVPKSGEQIAAGLGEAYGFSPEAFIKRCETIDLGLFLGASSRPRRPIDRRLMDNLDHTLQEAILADRELMEAVDDGIGMRREYEVNSSDSVDFAVGLAGVMARKWGRDGWPGDRGDIRMFTRGTAGQSYGAFCIEGLHLTHYGSCNDAVAKGMSGGRIVICQPERFPGRSWMTTLVGNTVAFGATGGKLFVQGRAGQRLGVRNSGATIVCEGAGQYACEYMTSGIAVFLGSMGDGIGAGMTDGKIYIYDPEDTQEARFTIDDRSVAIESPSEEELYGELAPLLEEFIEVAGSSRAREARQNLFAFSKIIPISIHVRDMAKKHASDLGLPTAG